VSHRRLSHGHVPHERTSHWHAPHGRVLHGRAPHRRTSHRRVLLIRMLDLFNERLNQLYLGSGMISFSSTHLSPIWSYRQEPGNHSNNLLKSAAQFGVLPYLVAKISSVPSAFHTKGSTRSLLESAVFGPSIWVDRTTLSTRRDTVAFLLDVGASLNKLGPTVG